MSLTRSKSQDIVRKVRGAIFRAPLFLTLTLPILAGCRNKPTPVAALSGYARLPELEKIHSGWKKIAEIDTLIGKLQSDAITTSGKLATPMPAYNAQTFKSPVAATPEKTINVPDDILKNQSTSKARIQSLISSLTLHDKLALDREQVSLAKRMSADIAAERARLIALPNVATESPERIAARRKLRPLLLEQIALQSEERVLTLPAITLVRERLAILEKEIAAIRESIRPLRVENEAILESRVLEFRKLQEKDLTRKIAALADTQRVAREKLASDYAKRYEASRNEITLPKPLTLPYAPALQLRPDVAIVESSAQSTSPIASPGSSRKDSLVRLREYRAKLVEFVATDTLRKASRISEMNHWKVSFKGLSGGVDLTARLAEELRKDRSALSSDSP